MLRCVRRSLLILLMTAALPLRSEDVIVFACDFRLCVDQSKDEWDRPTCSEYELNNALIESVDRGDLSAIAPLEERYDSASTYDERHRIADALLGRAPDDARYWNELASHANIVVRFPDEHSEEYLHWCGERGLDPSRYYGVATTALVQVATDRRSRDLLVRALTTNDALILGFVIWGLGEQQAEEMLPEIEKVLDRAGDRSPAFELVSFRSLRADALALKYVSEPEYRQVQAARASASLVE